MGTLVIKVYKARAATLVTAVPVFQVIPVTVGLVFQVIQVILA